MLVWSGLFLCDLPLAIQPRATALVADALGTQATDILANARMRVEQTDEEFTFGVISPERAPVERRHKLRCRPNRMQRPKQEAEARAKALRKAAVWVTSNE